MTSTSMVPRQLFILTNKMISTFLKKYEEKSLEKKQVEKVDVPTSEVTKLHLADSKIETFFRCYNTNVTNHNNYNNPRVL